MEESAGTLRWGILSTARIATEKVIPGIKRAARCDIVAIGSRDAGRARAVAETYSIPRVHGSYDALLADENVDAVYIPLPNHLHAEWTLRAAEAGKHVLCEKPLALTPAEAERMIDGCSRAGVTLVEAFMYRVHPSWLAVRELVADGRIGRLTAVDATFAYFNDDPANIRNVRAYGGGALYDIGCYAVNLSRMLFGTEPDGVQARVVRDLATGVDTLTSAILGFSTGTATFTAATRMEPDQRVDIHGTAGRIHVPIPFNIPPDRPTEIHILAGGEPPVAPGREVLTFPTADPYAMEAERFASVVLDGAQPDAAADDAVKNLRVIERIFRAAETGRTT